MRRMKHTDFIFTEINSHLIQLAEELQAGKESRHILLIGETGSGKTTFLKNVLKGNNVCWYTYEDVVSMVLRKCKEGVPYSIPESDIIVVEDMGPQAQWMEATLEEIKGVLSLWKEKTVIFTCTVRYLHNSGFLSDMEVVSVNKVETTEDIVRIMAKAKGLELTSNEATCLLGVPIDEINGQLNKIKFKREQEL